MPNLCYRATSRKQGRYQNEVIFANKRLNGPFSSGKMAAFEGCSYDIIKSCEDKREYKGYELENKMKVLLVSDPTTEKAAAAADVHIGKMT